jgi:hypothetical protein
MLTLVNGLDHAIYIRGLSRTLTLSRVIDVMRADSEISCMTLPTSPESTPESNASLFGSVDVVGKWQYVEVPANGRAKLVIATTFPQEHKRNRCRISVRLKDGTVVGPTEFRS